MQHHCLAIGSLLLGQFAAPLCGQAGIATSGRVVDDAGDPIARVTVTFAGDRPPLHLASTTPHVVTATTDQDGRFRVGLRPGHEYCAHAVGEPALDGRCRVSALHQEVLPGAALTIPLVRQRSPARLRVRGLERWSELGPLSMRVAVAAPCLVTRPLPLGPEPSPLPPLPDGQSWLVFVDDGHGRLLVAAEVPPEPGDLTFFVPPPLSLRLRVVDDDHRPVAGAVVRAEVDAARRPPIDCFVAASSAPRWRDVGISDANGHCTVLVPERRLAGALHGDTPALHACRNGASALRAAGPSHGGELELQLLTAQEWQGRLLAHGRPLADTTLLLHAGLVVRGPVGSSRRAIAFATTTGKDGSFTFGALPPGLVDPRLMLAEPTSSSAPRAAPPALQPPVLDQRWERDLGELPLLTLDVGDASGRPCPHAFVGLLPGPTRDSNLAHERFVARLDAGGKTTIPVDRGDWYVFVTDRTGFAAAALTVTASQLLSLRLQPLATMSGRLLLPARCDARETRFVLNQSRLASPGADRLQNGLRAVDAPLNRWLLQRPELFRDGAFVLRFLAVDGASHSGLVTTPAGVAPFHLTAGGAPVELTPGS